MDLPEEHLDGLKVIATLSDKPFKAIVKRAVLDGTDPSKREHVSSLLVKCPDLAADQVRCCHAALLATFVEHVRRSPSDSDPAGEARLATTLEEAGWMAERQTALLELVAQARPAARQLLARVGYEPPRLVDVRWREVVTVQSSVAGAAANRPHFEVTFVMLPSDSAVQELTLTCSRERLQETVTSLRQAVRALETIADGSASLPEP
ncbi:uncharacterized protein LOC119114229 isoform X1 [Pollicipes pollicipes]|uniref:uncharacterized protein LOC119114229 isoform X1 n=1 Tax=Pollicipes pollicipes TaxID=41117 RepID=UPI0018858C22|nr:uncharacterized protein LOC119114229 isoform X1 [Pollicipes pollicipes]